MLRDLAKAGARTCYGVDSRSLSRSKVPFGEAKRGEGKELMVIGDRILSWVSWRSTWCIAVRDEGTGRQQ